MNTEQERAEFEAWYEREYSEAVPCGFSPHRYYLDARVQLLFRCWGAARAALQSQKPEPNNLMLSAVIRMPFEMAMADPISRMQFYQRAQQALNELEALQSQDRDDAERLDFLSSVNNMGCSLVSDDDGRWAFSDSGVAPVPPEGGFTEYASIVSWVEPDMWKESLRAAIDHARRVEGE